MTHLARRPRPFSDLYKTTTLTALHTPSPAGYVRIVGYAIRCCTVHLPAFTLQGNTVGHKEPVFGGGRLDYNLCLAKSLKSKSVIKNTYTARRRLKNGLKFWVSC